MTPDKLDKKVREEIKNFDFSLVKKQYSELSTTEQEIVELGIYDNRTTLYHKWLWALIKVVQPKFCIELGTHIGLSTGCLLAAMGDHAKLISVDCNEELSGRVLEKDNRLTKIIGDDLDLDIYPDLNILKQATVWFIDSDHTEDHFKSTINLYKQFWKPNDIIVVDDIDEQGENFGIYKVWQKLTYRKKSLPDLHYTGFGFFIL